MTECKVCNGKGYLLIIRELDADDERCEACNGKGVVDVIDVHADCGKAE